MITNYRVYLITDTHSLLVSTRETSTYILCTNRTTGIAIVLWPLVMLSSLQYIALETLLLTLSLWSVFSAPFRAALHTVWSRSIVITTCEPIYSSVILNWFNNTLSYVSTDITFTIHTRAYSILIICIYGYYFILFIYPAKAINRIL